jgi:hypothetical protein
VPYGMTWDEFKPAGYSGQLGADACGEGSPRRTSSGEPVMERCDAFVAQDGSLHRSPEAVIEYEMALTLAMVFGLPLAVGVRLVRHRQGIIAHLRSLDPSTEEK